VPDKPHPNKPDDNPVRTRLRELAQAVRRAHHLEPETRRKLADLLTGLSQDLKPETLSAEDKAHLVAGIVELSEALEQEKGTGPLTKARGRLEEAVVEAQAEAPVATGFLRRLIDALANIGI
jgi:uncharacterized protein DUF4404